MLITSKTHLPVVRNEVNMNIKKYTKQDGKIYYKFQAYLGTDETTGERIRVTRQGFTSKKSAQLEYARLKLKAEQGSVKEPQAITFLEVYNEWIEQYKNTVKASTLNSTLNIFRLHLLPAYGHMKIAKIKPTHCQKAINKWFTFYKKYRQLNAYAGMVFRYAITKGYVDKDPTKLITIPVIKEKPEEEKKNFYSKEELQQFFSFLEVDEGLKWLVFFRVLAFTGIRRGEALALSWCDIDYNNSTISVSKTLSLGLNNKPIIQTPKTKTSKRVIIVDNKTLTMLKKWRTEQNLLLGGFGYKTLKPNQLVFTTNNNQFIPLPQAGHIIDRVCKKHNFKRITTHGFRHTHCSLLFEAGATLKEVQDRLGHNNIQTTMNIYAHVTEKGKEKTAEKFARYVNF